METADARRSMPSSADNENFGIANNSGFVVLVHSVCLEVVKSCCRSTRPVF